MKNEVFDFYDKTTLKSYNLTGIMRYQLNMLDSLDVFTRKHCENVANITCRLCQYLHLSEEFTVYATTCAYLHDIGKLFIPSSILQKKGPLTNEEYEIMKTHTTIGYNMCMKDEKLRPYSAGPIYHHEALNGSGYPKGLNKKEIPMVGQIIRVADEYDALVSKRQYKSHIDITDALKIIIDNTQPEDQDLDKVDTMKVMIQNSKLGKDNPKIVKALFKVVIDDIEYEISCTIDYIKYLEDNIKRLKEANKYYEKMQSAKNQKEQKYNEEGVKCLLVRGETFDKFPEIYQEYQTAYELRKDMLTKLYDEVKKVKKLRV